MLVGEFCGSICDWIIKYYSNNHIPSFTDNIDHQQGNKKAPNKLTQTGGH